MSKLLPILVSLGFKAENTALFFLISIGVIALFAVLYHFQKLINKDISHIKETLNNHITDLKKGQDKLESKQDKLDSKIDSKFDNLQNILLSNKFETPKK